jgi:hypothetical protein
MIDDMGIFRTTIRVAHVTNLADQRTLIDVMVDTGSEYTWIPRDVLDALDVEPERLEAFETARLPLAENACAFSASGSSTRCQTHGPRTR